MTGAPWTGARTSRDGRLRMVTVHHHGGYLVHFRTGDGQGDTDWSAVIPAEIVAALQAQITWDPGMGAAW